MKVIVTGGSGLAGSALKSLCIDDSNWIFINRNDCDLTNREQTIKLFTDIKADCIVHLASYVPGFYSINKVKSFSDNIKINENVLEASNLSGIQKGLFCLSVTMFQENPSSFPMNESMIFDGILEGPFAGYSYAKRMLAFQCQTYNEQFNRQYFGIIPSNIYGQNDNYKSGRLIPNIICKFKEAIKNNTDVVINGAGKPLRQFICSDDFAIIIKYLIKNYNETKPIICCGDEEITIKELLYKISKIMNFKNKIIFDISKADGNIRKTMNNSYLKSIMPDIKFTSLDNGIINTINYMDKL